MMKLLTLIALMFATASFSEELSWETVFNNESPYFCALKLPEEWQKEGEVALPVYLEFYNEPKMYFSVTFMAGKQETIPLKFMHQGIALGVSGKGMEYGFVATVPSGIFIIVLENYQEKLPTKAFMVSMWPGENSELKLQGFCEQPPDTLFN